MRSIRTPSLDALAGRGVRFNRHYAGGFPTMPTRADHATGRWTASFMTWEPLPDGVTTLAETLAAEGVHTAAMVDTPFYLREGMNYDRGFQTFNMYSGQVGGGILKTETAHHESEQARYAWRYESDRNVARTVTNAMEWLQLHYDEDFFLYIDTWDPHEPWDAPSYYTELYMPDYDGELVHPIYGRWHEMPGYSAELVDKAHATYCGEVTMVDTWIGYLLRMVENMGLTEKTAIIFTSDHGFYFGEHGGWFGKLQFAKKPDGSLYQFGEPDAIWGFSPLYEELTLIPLLVSVPGVEAGTYDRLTSVVDVMPTVLDVMGLEAPSWVDGRSLLAGMRDPSLPGRDFTVTTVPFANPGDAVHAVDDRRRQDVTRERDDGHDGRMGAPVQSGGHAFGTLQPQGRPEAGEQRHCPVSRTCGGDSRTTRRLHAGDGTGPAHVGVPEAAVDLAIHSGQVTGEPSGSRAA